MDCCGKCFNDRGLELQIIPAANGSVRNCATCGASGQLCVDARTLADYFELVCGIYVPGEDGKVIIDWLIDDWQLFSVPRDTANALLVEILNDGERVRQRVVPSDSCKSNRLDRWEELRNELRHQNRFFPDTDFEHGRLEDLFTHLMISLKGDDCRWYRARIQKSESPYPVEQMGAPPKKVASHGRANPAGIPYLYLGSKTEAAIAEVRPHPGESICVADFQLAEETKVVDLRNPRQLVSPFLLSDEHEIALLRGDIEFLERLGQELTTPVLPNAAAIDYIPSQYLCEFIKKCRHLGVLYSSSISDGVNLALFDPGLAKVGTVKRFRVNSVDVGVQRLTV